MAIPAHRDIDLALLVELVRTDRAVRPAEVYTSVAKHFLDLTEEDLAKTRPDGRTKVFRNMVNWGRDRLRVRGLLAQPAPGLWAVNDLAKEALVADLQKRGVSKERAAAFVTDGASLSDLLGPNWARQVRSDAEIGRPLGAVPAAKSGQPEETRMIAEHPEDERVAIKRELLGRLNRMEGYEFEQFVARMLDSLGFRDTQVVGRSGDEGVDVLSYLHSPLITAKIAVQVKRHTANVGPKDVSYLRDRWARRADRLLIVTTSEFTPGAREVANEEGQAKVELVGGGQLISLMLEHGIGVKSQPVVKYDIDEDYFVG